MRKFIAALSAAVIAISGAVFVAPSAAAVQLVPVDGIPGFEQVGGAIEDIQAKTTLDVDWYGEQFEGYNCGDGLRGYEVPGGTDVADVIKYFRNNRNPQDPACKVAFTVVKKGSVFPDAQYGTVEYWFGQNFLDTRTDAIFDTNNPKPAEAYENCTGQIDVEDRRLKQPKDFPLIEDEANALCDKGKITYVKWAVTYIYGQEYLKYYVGWIDVKEPQVDADCAADEMVVPTSGLNECITIPTAVTGDEVDEKFNAAYAAGFNNTDYALLGHCTVFKYIGTWMDMIGEPSWQDWYRENMALNNVNEGAFSACQRDAANVDPNYLMKSHTSFNIDDDFFTVDVDGEELCAITPLDRDNRHAQHCQTPVNFSQWVSLYVDDLPPDPGFEPDVDPNPEVTVDLPLLPNSLDYKFAYEQGEAGVCLYPDEGEVEFVQNGVTFCGTPVENPVDVEPIQEWNPPPPECWQGPNNCPVGQSISYAVPPKMMVGVPVNVTVYATRTVEDEFGRFNYGQPDNGTAVIHYGDHESDPPVAGVPFVDGAATFRVVPQEAGKKNFSICGVLNSGTSGGNAYIDCVDGETTVLPYDPETYRKAFRDLVLEKGDKFTIVDRDQAKGKIAKRLEWRVAQSDEDVCAVYETKKGKVRAKFNKTGECTVLWEDPKTGESGRLQIGS